MSRFAPEDWRGLLDCLPCLLAVYETGSGRSYANRALSAFCMIEPEHQNPLGMLAGAGSLYRPDGTLYPPELLPARVAAMSGGAGKGIEIVFRRPDGSEALTL